MDLHDPLHVNPESWEAIMSIAEFFLHQKDFMNLLRGDNNEKCP